MEGSAGQGRRARGSTRAAKRERQRQIGELVTHYPVGSQQELAQLLAARGHRVTQATVSRDIAELGLVKVTRANGHVYASPEDLAVTAPPTDDRLRRVTAEYPIRVARSGLSLLLISMPGTAGAIAQAIDESTFLEQEGTLAGDNTVLVLFADEERLERWRERFVRLQADASSRRADVRGGDMDALRA